MPLAGTINALSAERREAGEVEHGVTVRNATRRCGMAWHGMQAQHCAALHHSLLPGGLEPGVVVHSRHVLQHRPHHDVLPAREERCKTLLLFVGRRQCSQPCLEPSARSPPLPQQGMRPHQLGFLQSQRRTTARAGSGGEAGRGGEGEFRSAHAWAPASSTLASPPAARVTPDWRNASVKQGGLTWRARRHTSQQC